MNSRKPVNQRKFYSVRFNLNEGNTSAVDRALLGGGGGMSLQGMTPVPPTIN